MLKGQLYDKCFHSNLIVVHLRGFLINLNHVIWCQFICVGLQYGRTPSLIAAEKGHLEVCKWLVQAAGVDVNKTNKVSIYECWGSYLLFNSRVSIHISPHRGVRCAVSVLCSGRNVYLSPQTTFCSDGNNYVVDDDNIMFGNNVVHLTMTSTIYSPSICHFEVQLCLTDSNITFDAAGTQHGEAQLLCASAEGHLEVCKWLVQSAGADANKTNNVSVYVICVSIVVSI
jgi:Ankyrin repeat